MHFRLRTVVLLLISVLAFPGIMKASVVFQPGKKAKFIAPGEEQLSGNAKELFQKGQEAEARGNLARAVKCYKALVRHYSRDALAPGALYRAAELEEKRRHYIGAAGLYRVLVERYPTSPHFDDAIEAQFRIGELYLSGKKIKVLGVPMHPGLDKAVEIFAAVIRTAPYGKYTARAQFDIGLAREKQSLNDAALDAYRAVVDKFPEQPMAAAAQYQIGYLWFEAARAGTKDIEATTKAKTAFQDFLFRYPDNEKASQARAYLKQLEAKQTTSSLKIAQFYDRQRNYRAAVIYYNEVIRQQPGSAESEQAQKRIDQLRAKLGEAALQPAFVAAEAEAKKKKEAEKQKTGTPSGSPGKPPAIPEGENAASETAPSSSPQEPASEPSSVSDYSSTPPPSSPVSDYSPPPATDLALPPSSLSPERTASPAESPAPEASPSPTP